MTTVTKAHLQALVDRLNRLTDSPAEPYKLVEGKYEPQAGCYHIEGAYGGWKLARMCAGGGSADVLPTGFVSRRSLYDSIYIYLRGIDDGIKLSREKQNG